MKKLVTITSVVLTGALICSPLFASAAAVGAPVDGGVSLLIAAGVSYGAKQLAKRKRNKNLAK